MIFKGNSFLSNEPNTVIYLDDQIISEEEMKKIDAEVIKSVDVKKGNIKKEIKIVTKNSSGLTDDTEIYINGKKATKEELDKIEREEIESVNVNNNNGKKSIEIQKRNIKTIQGGSWKDVEREIEMSKAEMEKAKAEIEKAKAEMERNKNTKIIETENGNQSVIYGGNRLKIPGVPSIKIENGKLDIYVNGKKLKNAEDFLTMNHDKIYFLKKKKKGTNENNIVVVKKIEVKTK